MTTVTIGVSSIEETKQQLAAAFRADAQGEFISFETPELLWKTLTAKRWEILRAMAGQDAMSIREAARRVGRDVKRVHEDMHALLNAGVIDKTDDGRVVFPYDEIHVDFTVNKAA